MFEKFTGAARQAVVHALGEARGATAIDTGHLLAALAADEGATGRLLREAGVTLERVRADLGRAGSLDPMALWSIGIDYDEVRRAVDGEFGSGALEQALDRRPRRGRRPRLAPEARDALAQALRHAVAERDREIGAEHLLLGVVQEPGSRAARLLDSYGVDVAVLRRAVLDARPRRAG